MYSWWKALEKVIKFFDKINIGKNKKFNKRVPHSHIKKIRHNKRMPMESAIEISTQENSFPKISCKVENQKHLWWISDWDRSWWYHIILTNLLSMILHRSIYFSADTALGLSMESYPCKNRNIKCGQQATSEFQKPSPSKWGQVHNFSCENEFYLYQNLGAKKIIFTAYHSSKLKLEFTSPDVISTSP